MIKKKSISLFYLPTVYYYFLLFPAINNRSACEIIFVVRVDSVPEKSFIRVCDRYDERVEYNINDNLQV